MTMKKRHKAIEILQHAVLTLLAIYTLAPLVFLVVNAFKSNNEIVSSPVSFPKIWSFQYIRNAMEEINFTGAIGITFVITSVSILLIVLVSAFAAWAMVRSKSLLSV